MKQFLLLLLASVTIFSACTEDECTSTYVYEVLTPVYKTMTEINEDIKFSPERVLEKPGKIYYYDKYILINESEQGVHIYDNSDIRRPVKKGFLEIPGNIDIAMTSHYIYADMTFNIVVIDIADISKPSVVNVLNQVKEEWWPKDDQGRFITQLKLSETTQSFPCGTNYGPVFYDKGSFFLDSNVARSSSGGFGSLAPLLRSVPEFNTNGTAGSLSRMALFDGYFYYVNTSVMHVFDVSTPDKPEKLNEVNMQWGVETIFPYEDKLFIGANNGMHIYDNQDKSSPVFLSTFAHARACDPVAVEGKTAYVTLRDGTECETFINQLDIVDVSDVLKPTLIKSYPMHHPIGLSVRNNILYLCEDDHGLKIFDVTDPLSVDKNLIGAVKDYQAQDVISLSDRLLLMVGADGFYQFDTKNPAKPEILSTIKIGQ